MFCRCSDKKPRGHQTKWLVPTGLRREDDQSKLIAALVVSGMTCLRLVSGKYSTPTAFSPTNVLVAHDTRYRYVTTNQVSFPRYHLWRPAPGGALYGRLCRNTHMLHRSTPAAVRREGPDARSASVICEHRWQGCNQGRRQGGGLGHGLPLGAEGALCDCSAPCNRECFYRENIVGGRQWRRRHRFSSGGARDSGAKPRVPPNPVFSPDFGHLFFNTALTP